MNHLINNAINAMRQELETIDDPILCRALSYAFAAVVEEISRLDNGLERAIAERDMFVVSTNELLRVCPGKAKFALEHRPDVNKWCRDNLNHYYALFQYLDDYAIIVITDQNDQVHFKLRWSSILENE